MVTAGAQTLAGAKRDVNAHADRLTRMIASKLLLLVSIMYTYAHTYQEHAQVPRARTAHALSVT